VELRNRHTTYELAPFIRHKVMTYQVIAIHLLPRRRILSDALPRIANELREQTHTLQGMARPTQVLRTSPKTIAKISKSPSTNRIQRVNIFLFQFGWSFSLVVWGIWDLLLKQVHTALRLDRIPHKIVTVNTVRWRLESLHTTIRGPIVWKRRCVRVCPSISASAPPSWRILESPA